MSNDTNDKSNGLCEMLPWYVNGTLNDIEVQAIEGHLSKCEACTRELPVLERVQSLLRKESVAVLPPAAETAEFIAGLDRHHSSGFAKRTAWLVTAVAAAAGVASLALAINNYYSTQPTTGASTFETVIGADSTATFDYVLHVSLRPELDTVEHLAILNSLAPVSVADLDSSGRYKVVVRLQAQSLDELERYRADLESNTSFADVSIVAIELPVAPR